jgi:hypothetical protein
MTTARNDITGDSIQSKPSSDLYRDGWERIFGKKPPSDTQNTQDHDQDTHQ